MTNDSAFATSVDEQECRAGRPREAAEQKGERGKDLDRRERARVNAMTSVVPYAAPLQH